MGNLPHIKRVYQIITIMHHSAISTLLGSYINPHGVGFCGVKETSTAAGRFFFHVMSALAEMERELIVERTRAGLAAAREQGRIGG
ncbi:recombinase family protein, partial [Klebsiella pneumoniae]|uniref:recombinase family protein n=1 Tax=Klebsiella pneumoniae TaxID=573 RepID=UPI002A0A7E11